MIDDEILVQNYKCFGNEPQGFKRILPINIIIGKNNSGKSSLIDLIKYTIKPFPEFSQDQRNSGQANLHIRHKLTESEIAAYFKPGTTGGGIPNGDHYGFAKQFIGQKYYYTLGENNTRGFIGTEFDCIPAAHEQMRQIAQIIESPFNQKVFRHITAERDIVPEIATSSMEIQKNGIGSTNAVQLILNLVGQQYRLIEVELLKDLNDIVNPDIFLSRILVQINSSGLWEIYFEDSTSKRITLSNMGSGIKTILLVLLNLRVLATIGHNEPNRFVFCFEELENNLHPSLQRRLFNYIKKFSERHGCLFFLTTHSNIVIDTFSGYENAQIIHVTNDGNKAISTTLETNQQLFNLISDLGLKASDILQTNGIIWVEGPSDRNYINKWISLLAPEYKEGIHYSIMFYGGKLLSNLTFDFDWFNTHIIPLLTINRNGYVVLDRDGKTENAKINATKRRITKEIGENKFWITKGREIENYLSDSVVSKWLEEKCSIHPKFTNDKNEKLEINISKSNKKITLLYNTKKQEYSSEIVNYINVESIDIMDLKAKLEELISNVRKWNA